MYAAKATSMGTSNASISSIARQEKLRQILRARINVIFDLFHGDLSLTDPRRSRPGVFVPGRDHLAGERVWREDAHFHGEG